MCHGLQVGVSLEARVIGAEKLHLGAHETSILVLCLFIFLPLKAGQQIW